MMLESLPGKNSIHKTCIATQEFIKFDPTVTELDPKEADKLLKSLSIEVEDKEQEEEDDDDEEWEDENSVFEPILPNFD